MEKPPHSTPPKLSYSHLGASPFLFSQRACTALLAWTVPSSHREAHLEVGTPPHVLSSSRAGQQISPAWGHLSECLGRILSQRPRHPWGLCLLCLEKLHWFWSTETGNCVREWFVLLGNDARLREHMFFSWHKGPLGYCQNPGNMLFHRAGLKGKGACRKHPWLKYCLSAQLPVGSTYPLNSHLRWLGCLDKN